MSTCFNMKPTQKKKVKWNFFWLISALHTIWIKYRHWNGVQINSTSSSRSLFFCLNQHKTTNRIFFPSTFSFVEYFVILERNDTKWHTISLIAHDELFCNLLNYLVYSTVCCWCPTVVVNFNQEKKVWFDNKQS